MITRFAPSPTGLLHLGHAFSACLAHDRARAAGGVMLLRIEDTDSARCSPEYEAAIYHDLEWLGLDWPRPVMRQSERLGAYQAALAALTARGVLYPCRCTRGDIRAALAAPQEAARAEGLEAPRYPGTCRGRSMAEARPGDAIRIDMARALARIGPPRTIGFDECGSGAPVWQALDPALLVEGLGDVVLARRDHAVAYHLAVVVDDAAQAVTEVVRGADILPSTHCHLVLHRLLDLPTPAYHHHRLIRDETGKRLAKRDDARAIARYRHDGATPADIRRMLELPLP